MNPQPPTPTPETDNSLASRLGRWWHSLNGPMRALAILAIALGLGLLGLALYDSLRQETPAPAPTTQTTQPTAEVSITKDGLTPATIKVDTGTQVTWTNNDTKPHQVSADPHPLHDTIEGFDSDNVLQPGDSLSFTFETPGTYQVHDHLDYLDKTYHGTVEVE